LGREYAHGFGAAPGGAYFRDEYDDPGCQSHFAKLLPHSVYRRVAA